MNRIRLFAATIALLICGCIYAQDQPSIKGFRMYANAGFLFKTSETMDSNDGFSAIPKKNSNVAKLDWTGGYQFSNHFFLGAGTGFGYLSAHDGLFIPVFANIHINFTKTKVIPYADAKLGFAFCVDKRSRDNDDVVGSYISYSLGAKMRINKGKNAISAGIEHMIFSNLSDNDTGALGIKVGYEF